MMMMMMMMMMMKRRTEEKVKGEFKKRRRKKKKTEEFRKSNALEQEGETVDKYNKGDQNTNQTVHLHEAKRQVHIHSVHRTHHWPYYWIVVLKQVFVEAFLFWDIAATLQGVFYDAFI